MKGLDHRGAVAQGDNRLREPLDALIQRIPTDWRPIVDAWRQSSVGQALVEWVDARVAGGAVVYPAHVFRALELTPMNRVRGVILGQDPYHGAGQAEGLAFSVPDGQPLPPSLRNIFKEIQRDIGWQALPKSGHLGAWSRAGMLLLNTSLTVEEGRPGSHAECGWEALTDALVAAVAQRSTPTVFMLWGAHAQSKLQLIHSCSGAAEHLLLQSNHPSPLSATRGVAPFIGNGHFGRAGAFLAQKYPGQPSPPWALQVELAEVVEGMNP